MGRVLVSLSRYLWRLTLEGTKTRMGASEWRWKKEGDSHSAFFCSPANVLPIGWSCPVKCLCVYHLNKPRNRVIKWFAKETVKGRKMEVKAGFMSLFVSILWITVVLTNVAAVDVCPDKCICQDTTIRCTKRQLVSIPEIPDDTTIV